MAGEEGTLGTNVFAMTLEKLYFIFRFPTHSLFSFFYSNGWSWFVIGLIFNCLLYGILTERFICFYKNIAGKNGK